MRQPSFENRAYDTVMVTPNAWLIVFPSAKERAANKLFKGLRVSSCGAFQNAYECDLEFIRNIGFMKPIELRSRGSSPRMFDKVMIDGDDRRFGVIVAVDYPEHLVTVEFPDEYLEWSWRDLEGNWTDKFGGTYVMEI